MLGRSERERARHLAPGRAEQRDQPSLQRALVQLHVVAEAEAADDVEQLLQRDALGVEQDLLAGVEDPHVGEHLALGAQQRRVAPRPGHERLDVVGDLALQERLGVGAGEGELAAL
jgi:hypothetical protein